MHDLLPDGDKLTRTVSFLSEYNQDRCNHYRVTVPPTIQVINSVLIK